MYYLVEIGKLKSQRDMEIAYMHNVKEKFCENEDNGTTINNIGVLNRRIDYWELFNKKVSESSFYAKNPKNKLRDDAILGLDIMIKLITDDEEKVDFDYENLCLKSRFWLTKQFRESNIASINLHMEPSPHVHSVVIPMLEDGRVCASYVLYRMWKNLFKSKHIVDELQPLSFVVGQKKTIPVYVEVLKNYGKILEMQYDYLPIPDKNESAEHYYERAQKAFNDFKERALDTISSLKKRE